MEKTCVVCGETKPIDEFGRRSDAKDGRRNDCKRCNSQRAAQYYAERRDAINARLRDQRAASDAVRERDRAYWAARPEQKRAKDLRYAAKHREEAAAKTRAWRAANPERAKAEKRRYYEANKETWAARHRANYAINKEAYVERARKRNTVKRAVQALNGRHTPAEWRAKLAEFGGKCAYCGATERIQRDHIIPLSKGGSDTIDNIQPLCKTCNCRKSAS